MTKQKARQGLNPKNQNENEKQRTEKQTKSQELGDMRENCGVG